MNNVSLTGRLTKDPVVRTINTANGQTNLCDLRIAVKRRRVNSQQDADFFNVTCFGKTADAVAQCCKKGHQIGVSGRLTSSEYTNRQGQKVYSVSVTAESVDFLEKKDQNQNAGQYGTPDPQGYQVDQYGAPAAAPQGYQPGQYGAPAPAQQTAQQYGAPAQQTAQQYGGNYAATPASAPASTPQATQQYGGNFAAAAASAPVPGYGSPAPAQQGSGFINIPDGISDEDLPFH